MNIIKKFLYLPRRVVLLMIRGYQKTLSLDHGPLSRFFPHGYCRYYPTCSQYGYDAIKKYGLFKGGLKAVWRIVRCNPWSQGGIDHVK